MKKLATVLLGFSIALASFHSNAQNNATADEDIVVGISEAMPYKDINHQGIPVRLKRVQDTSHRMIDDFAKTSRPCPPFCIHPMEAAPGVKTVGELEIIDFVAKDVEDGTGLLIDARMPNFYNSETIPGSVNIPFVLFTSSAEALLPLLGVFQADDGAFDFSTAKSLLLFCNGPWCDQSPRAIQGLIDVNYPRDKIFYYRGGMQLWKSFSLTTIQPISNEVSN